ncbi:MAG: hypothetical protein JNL96_14325 [Planctomycetaceae bacterium]|nr:hypothetical protein [Planctomycetaceae bacterium]
MPSCRRILALAALNAAIFAPAVRGEPQERLLSVRGDAPVRVKSLLDHHLADDLFRLHEFFFAEQGDTGLKTAKETKFVIYGTLDAYRDALASEGIRIANPACYIPGKREIWLGYDGARFDAALSAAAAAAESAEGRVTELQVSFARRQKQDEARYEREKIPPPRRKELQAQARREFQKTLAAMQRESEAAEKSNSRLLNEATARLKAAATHELVHYFVDVALPRSGRGELPTWLNEGTAQVFEHTPWRSGPDAFKPPPELPRQWRAVGLSAQNPPSLRELLTADAKEFLVHDPEAKAEVRRKYVLAWSVAQLLAKQEKLGDRAALERYWADVKTEPIARFEKYLGRPLAEFEAEWRKFVRPFGP